MGTAEDALVALDARLGVPDRDLQGDVALLVARGADGIGAVDRHRRNRQGVAAGGDHLGGHAPDELGGVGRNGAAHVGDGGRLGRHRHAVDPLPRQLRRPHIHLDNGAPLVAVAVLDRQLDHLVGLGLRQHAGDGEEGRLHDGIDAPAQPERARQIVGVDDVERRLLVDQGLLDLARQVVPNLVRRERAVEQKGSPRTQVVEHLETLDERKGMAGEEVGLIDQIGTVDQVRTETQVGDRHRSGLLRVVVEEALGVVIGRLADDLDRVLVGPHRTVGAQAEEHRPVGLLRLADEVRVPRQAGAADIVIDADGEVVLRPILDQVVEDGLGHPGGEVLGRQAVATAENRRQVRHWYRSGRQPFGDGGLHVDVERLSGAAGLLRPVQHGDPANALRQRGNHGGRVERPIQPHLEQPDLLTTGVQGADDFLQHLGGRTHDDHDALGIRRADVVEEVVGAPDEPGKAIHHRLDDGRGVQVEEIDRFPPLEVDIRVLGGTAYRRTFGGEAALAVGEDQFLRDHRPQVVVAEHLDLLDLGRSAEAVEEVQERQARFERGGVGDERQVHHFLDAVRSQHRPPGGAGGHHVAVVAVDRQGVRRQGPGGDVEDCRRELAGDLEHVGDHQQQALRGGEGRRQGAGRDGAVHGAGGAAFRLHFDHRRHRPPDVLLAQGGFLIGDLAHRRRRRDGIDGDDLADGIGDVRRGGVAFDHRPLAAARDLPHETTPFPCAGKARAIAGKRRSPRQRTER